MAGRAAVRRLDARAGRVLAYAEPAEAAPAGSDAALLAEGFATVTALQATAELHVAELDDLLAE